MLQSTPNRWLVGGRGDSAAALRLFMFSYAGGGASVFRQWNRLMPPWIDAYAVQLPGRETRFTEPRLTRFPAAVEAIAEALRPSLDRPFAFFGHSMGAILAFETARFLRRSKAPTPAHLFVSGSSAPQIREPKKYADLPDDEFLQAVRKFGGIPDEVMQHTELLELMMPVLRADFALFESYQYIEEAVLDCPITAFGGLDDVDTPQDNLIAWNIHTSRAFRLSMFEGGHFYLYTAQNLLVNEISRELAPLH
jgi:medium-chain acyl-[acyl-carrier-protein] hydrolase